MLPLEGIKVVEVAQNLAGPFTGNILGHLGADVIKVERPEGDDARGWGPPFIDDAAASFHAVNLNKQSITLDLKDPAAIARLKHLVRDADVLVQNMRPGAMEKLGLGGEDLLALNPRLVYCSLWAFGAQGPMRLNPGYEPMVQAFSGLMLLSGEEGGPPVRMGTQVLDHGTAMWAALGITAALFRRDRTGRGGIVDTSLFETALGWMTIHFSRFGVMGTVPERHPTGNALVVVFQGFETQNGPVIVAAANDRLFAKLAAELGHPEWADDPRFKDNAARVANKAELIPQIEAIMLTRTKGDWIDRLTAVGVPCAPVHSMADVMDLPQTAATGMIQPVPGLDHRVMGLPIMFDGERPRIRSRAPKLGEHNAETGADGAD
ncbi:MAG: CoA transferase, partial [Minwuiales bacterium]|nr:CoA transferase [Minwuiales bacterium]